MLSILYAKSRSLYMHPLYYNENIFLFLYTKYLQNTQQNHDPTYKILNKITIAYQILYTKSWFHWVFFQLKKYNGIMIMCFQHNKIMISL